MLKAAGHPSLGEQVRNARGARGLRELARQVEITPSYLSDIEHDRRRPSENVWKRLTLAIPVYGGALVQDRLKQLERDEPMLYAAAITKGMARGRENAEVWRHRLDHGRSDKHPPIEAEAAQGSRPVGCDLDPDGYCVIHGGEWHEGYAAAQNAALQARESGGEP